MESTVKPKRPFFKRLDNFWYHYKFHTLVALFLLVIAGYALFSFFSREQYDYKVILYLSEGSPTEFTRCVETALERYGIDADGDGTVNVQVLDLSYDPTNSDPEYRLAQATTLGGELQRKTTYLFLTDPLRFEELDDMGLFGTQPGFSAQDGKAYSLNDTAFSDAVDEQIKALGYSDIKLPELLLCVRSAPKKSDGTPDTDKAVYQNAVGAAQAIVKAGASAQPETSGEMK